MKRTALLLALLSIAVLATGCGIFEAIFPPSSSDQSLPSPSGQPASKPPAAGQATLPAPASACQSRLWGKVTNTANGQSPANVSIEVVSAGKSFKTVTDSNGLYGFAGLCSGDYALSITPPGGKAIPNPNSIKLDGTQPVKVDLSYK